MKKTNKEYRQFLQDHFNGFVIRKPLFYNSTYGLRFNLQLDNTDSEEHFQEVNKRSATIFQSAFSPGERIILVLIEYKYKRKKISFYNYVFKQIDNLRKSEVFYSKIKNLYESFPKGHEWNQALIDLTLERINYKNILAAIANSDFSRQPSLDKYGFLSSKEIYFLNLDRKLIFHMYDDRGLDIIAVDKEILRPIYSLYNEWILDYDRKDIDRQFE